MIPFSLVFHSFRNMEYKIDHIWKTKNRKLSTFDQNPFQKIIKSHSRKIYLFHLLPTLVHPTRFYFCFYPDFFFIFSLSSNINYKPKMVPVLPSLIVFFTRFHIHLSMRERLISHFRKPPIPTIYRTSRGSVSESVHIKSPRFPRSLRMLNIKSTISQKLNISKLLILDQNPFKKIAHLLKRKNCKLF